MKRHLLQDSKKTAPDYRKQNTNKTKVKIYTFKLQTKT